MPIIAVLILAVVQGLTEFLPVSSKTHLLFARHFLSVKEDLAFDIILHAGSLLAILIHYRKAWLDLFRDRRREILPLTLASIPVALAGLLLREQVKPLYANLALAAGMLIVTGAWLFLADRLGREQHDTLLDAPLWKLLLVGLAQACAILPGISRSGSTIGAGFLLGLKRADAVRFSFFLGGAAIAMALAHQGLQVLRGQAAFELVPMIIGVSVAFAVSLAAIRGVEILSLKGRFSAFALYCGAAGLLGLIYFTRG